MLLSFSGIDSTFMCFVFFHVCRLITNLTRIVLIKCYIFVYFLTIPAIMDFGDYEPWIHVLNWNEIRLSAFYMYYYVNVNHYCQILPTTIILSNSSAVTLYCSRIWIYQYSFMFDNSDIYFKKMFFEYYMLVLICRQNKLYMMVGWQDLRFSKSNSIKNTHKADFSLCICYGDMFLRK